MNRFYLIDKPLGYSSFDVIRVLKKKFNIKKIGHTGTLDPLATGLLLIATGKYTKLIPYLNNFSKEYEFIVSLDGETASFDLGEDIKYLSILKQNFYKENLTTRLIQKIIEENFLGNIFQIPPKYSAVKINGKRAYSLAREGKKIELKKRKITIFNIKILSFIYPKLKLKAKVSTGTYIRSIASDLGRLLGTGGYITCLRRIKLGNLGLDTSYDLDSISENNFLDIKNLFDISKIIELNEEILKELFFGRFFYGKFNFPIGEDLFVYNNGVITNIVIYDGEKLIPKRII